MSKSKKIARRGFLAGLGGAAVSLPLLEIMGRPAPAKAASGGPTRFIHSFAGSSLPESEYVLPTTTGPGYDLPQALMPLAGVQAHCSIVSGLKIPWQGARGSASVPPGGRPANFHASTLGPVLSGAASLHDSGSPRPFAPTADQVVAPHLAAEDARFDSLEYRVQAAPYRGGASKGRISYERGSDGSIVAREPIASPALAYEQLFTGFIPTDPAEAERRRFLLRQDHSVLDLVASRSERLRARLGRPDQLRLERHFDEIRDLERRLSEIPEPAGACMVPTHPGDDPAEASYPESGRDGRIIGYANEELRAQVMADLIHMALVCDLTRTISWQLTFGQSFMSAQELLGVGFDFHELGHGAGSMSDFAEGVAWHFRHWAYLIEKLAGTPELDGTLLDCTAMVCQFEGGRGFDPEGGSEDSTHSSENMLALLAGHPGAMVNGEHIVATDRHPAEVTVSAMRALEIADPLGDLTEPIGTLLR